MQLILLRCCCTCFFFHFFQICRSELKPYGFPNDLKNIQELIPSIDPYIFICLEYTLCLWIYSKKKKNPWNCRLKDDKYVVTNLCRTRGKMEQTAAFHKKKQRFQDDRSTNTSSILNLSFFFSFYLISFANKNSNQILLISFWWVMKLMADSRKTFLLF